MLEGNCEHENVVISNKHATDVTYLNCLANEIFIPISNKHHTLQQATHSGVTDIWY